MTSARIRAFDWLRGIAVLVMIETHALVLLRPDLRAGRAFDWLQRIDGLVAPAFIFSAGFSLALVQVRGAASGMRGLRVRRTLRRLAEVLAVASLVNWMWFPLLREPKWLLRFDILHCIGLGLLLALPVFALSGILRDEDIGTGVSWTLLIFIGGIFGAGAASGLPTMHFAMERLASGAGDQRFALQRGDTFSVPCRTRFEHAAADAQLFSMSDEPLMRFSRFYRFEAD